MRTATRELRAGIVITCLALLATPARADDTKGTIEGNVASKPAKFRGGVVVHLEKAPGPFRPPAEPAVVDQRGMKFVPRVLPVLRGTTVNFLNSDSVRHNVFTPDGDKYNLGTWPQGETKSYTYAKSGVYRQLCNVHPEMEAFVVVLDNPYFAVTDEAGNFRIKDVPPGTWTIKTWSDKLAPATASVTVTAGAAASVKLELAKP
jgi:plastocyanin